MNVQNVPRVRIPSSPPEKQNDLDDNLERSVFYIIDI